MRQVNPVRDALLGIAFKPTKTGHILFEGLMRLFWQMEERTAYEGFV